MSRNVNIGFCCLMWVWILTVETGEASQLTVPIESNSTLRVELCFQDQCDEEVSPLEGIMKIALDCDGAPNWIQLLDYRFEAKADFHFRLNYPFLGNIVANAQDLVVMHPTSAPPPQAVPVFDGQFVFYSVPFEARGNGELSSER